MYWNKIKYCFTKLLVFVLAFQILNLSVQSGAQTSRKSVGKTIGASNQIDCFFEYFYEDICAFDSYNDAHDLALHNKLPIGHKLAPKFVDIQMPVQPVFTSTKTFFVVSRQNHFPLWDNKYAYLYAQDITPPPPKRMLIS